MKLDFIQRQEAELIVERMQDEPERYAFELVGLREIARLAKASIDNPAWAGVSDEDVKLEQAIRQYYDANERR